VLLGCLAVYVGMPYLLGLRGLAGLDLANYAARIHLFAQAWSAGDPFPELTRWTGCGEPFVLFNGSLASWLGGCLAWLLQALGQGAEVATARALRAVYVLCDAGAVLAAYWALRQAGASWAGALAGAAAWGCGWLRRGESLHAANLEHAAFLALLPLAAGLIARLVRRPQAPGRPTAALALVLALLVPIHPGLGVIFGVQLALLAGVAVGVRRRRPRESLAAGATAALWGALACAWFAGPLLAERGAFGQGVAPIEPEAAATLLDYLDRSLWFSAPGKTRFALSPSNYLSSAYAGISVVVLALAGAALPGRRRRAAACLLMALVSAVISLRPSWTTAVFGPVYGLASIRFAAPAFFWLCAGAALGVDSLARWALARTRNPAATLVVAVGAALVVAADFATLESHAGDRYAVQITDRDHPLCAQGGLLLGAHWEQIAAAQPSSGFDRVLSVPNYELHQGLLVHGRRSVDGLERHGWRGGLRQLLASAREDVVGTLAGRRSDPAALDRLGVRWVTTLLQPAVDRPGLRLVASDPEARAALYERAAPPPAWGDGLTATLAREADEDFELQVDGSGGPLVVSRQFHRRWEARWDDDATPLPVAPTADGLLQVEVPAGRGRLRVTLAPWGGRWLTRPLTALAWLLALAVCGVPAAYAPVRLRRLITAAA
jgi:hypothetical protein